MVTWNESEEHDNDVMASVTIRVPITSDWTPEEHERFHKILTNVCMQETWILEMIAMLGSGDRVLDAAVDVAMNNRKLVKHV